MPQRYPGYLTTLGGGNEPGRAMLFSQPAGQLTLTLRAGKFVLAADGAAPDVPPDQHFCAALDHWVSAVGSRTSPTSEATAINGGWLLFLGYELAGQIEPTVTLRHANTHPVAIAKRVQRVISLDRRGVCEVAAESDSLLDLEGLRRDIDLVRRLPYPKIDARITPVENLGIDYRDAVSRAREYIAAGEVYQVNLARQWHAPAQRDFAPALFESLCSANPAPFAALARFDQFDIVSSSPERLVAVTGRDISTRPIAGTRPRLHHQAADKRMIDELRSNQKEQAEHVMLVDLERNDLGRLCVAGTVRVDEAMTIETYERVHHIVSNIRGTLRDSVGPGAVIEALFPGGTITGCPKIRCMQIIDELEQRPRGAYTGSLGYLTCDGRMDLNILIRTLVVDHQKLTLSAGAGIVADSDPQREYDECAAKAAALHNAIQNACVS
ncbi:MAG: chorismate-binding protein [Pseudomonadota bacterium]